MCYSIILVYNSPNFCMDGGPRVEVARAAISFLTARLFPSGRPDDECAVYISRNSSAEAKWKHMMGTGRFGQIVHIYRTPESQASMYKSDSEVPSIAGHSPRLTDASASLLLSHAQNHQSVR